MANWFREKKEKEDELPERLRGKSPETIEAELKAAEEAKAKAEADKVAADEASALQANELNTLREQIKALEGNRQFQQLRQERDPNEVPSVVVDEDGAFNARMAPTNAVALHAGTIAAKLAAQDAVMSLGKDATERRMNQNLYRKYRSEIEAIVKSQPAQAQIMEQTWVNSFIYVKGQHLNDIMKSMSDGEDFFSERETSVGGKLETTTKPEGLTDQEKLIAKKTGVTEEQYLKYKNQIQVVS